MKHSRGSLNSGNRPKSYNWCIMGAYCWSILYQNGKPFQFGNANKWKIPTWNANEKNQSFLLIENMCGFFDVSNIAGCQLACYEAIQTQVVSFFSHHPPSRTWHLWVQNLCLAYCLVSPGLAKISLSMMLVLQEWKDPPKKKGLLKISCQPRLDGRMLHWSRDADGVWQIPAAWSLDLLIRFAWPQPRPLTRDNPQNGVVWKVYFSKTRKRFALCFCPFEK